MHVILKTVLWSFCVCHWLLCEPSSYLYSTMQ